MQKLVFEAENGNVLEFFHEPYILEHIDGVSELEASAQKTKGHTQNGETYHGKLYDSRMLTITGNIYEKGAGREDLYWRRVEMIRKLNPKVSGILYYTNDYGTWRIKAIPQKTPFFGTRIKNTLPFVVYFDCPTPFWEDVNETVYNLSYINGGFSLPLTLPAFFARFAGESQTVTNAGDEETPVIIDFFGPAETPIVENKTTGQFLKIDRVLSDRERIRINTEYGNLSAEVYRENGTVEDATAWLDIDSDYFRLAVGKNVISCKTGDDHKMTQVTLTYRNRYLGV